MKNLIVLFILTIITLSTSFGNTSELSKIDIPGIWLGKMKVTEQLELRIGFVISNDENDNLSATMNVIEQKAFDIPMDIVKIKNDSLYIEFSQANISYTGVYNYDSQTFNGNYVQGEANLKLNLHKTDKLPGEVIRTQTPVRPFPYIEEEVTFINNKAGVKLAGTLTKPDTDFPSPAIILVAGSGHTDRNETNMGHFLLLADFFTRNGIIVLRYDKRGVGESTGDYDSATSYDFADDVKAGINYLKNRVDVDENKIGIIGHSEGALLAPIVASELNDLSFIVLMAGIGIPCDQLMLLQSEKIAQINGVPENEIKKMTEQNKKYYDIINEFDNNETIREQILKSNPEIEEGLLGVLQRPWFQSFIRIDPVKFLEKVKCPVLALTGLNDVQCPPAENLSGIEQALKKGGNTDYITNAVPDLNHLFKTSTTGSPTEYDNIAEIIAPSAMSLMLNWINKKVNILQ